MTIVAKLHVKHLVLMYFWGEITEVSTPSIYLKDKQVFLVISLEPSTEPILMIVSLHEIYLFVDERV